ncbi:MAG TPA: GNAT family N-acetyltransferase [Gammaproteobacteria bacterium]|nr:GNAT family N-acetyltransferase [Gammaproteobacteria bacterium]
MPFIEQIANLRITVFKDYPYCYDGDMAYESEYLQTYTNCEESTIVIALSNQCVIGASTAIPLEFEVDAFKKPFEKENIKKIFYLGESVLLREFRGKNIYRHFFHEREKAALHHGCNRTTFCAVERPASNTLRPLNYYPLDAIWNHFKYEKNNGRYTYFYWKDIHETVETAKRMVYWEKTLAE